MKYINLFLLLVLCSFSQPPKSAAFLHKMYDRYHGKWRTSLTFIQQTEKYRNDSLISIGTWYETMVYPKLFRIDFGLPSEGNCVIFRNDSAYFFKNREQARSTVDTNDLLFFLGGMYFSKSFTEVATRFKSMQYDLSRGHDNTWKGKPVYVIGANKEGEEVNQLWVEKEHFNVVRFIKYDDDHKQEGILEEHKSLGTSWCETKVTFYIDGRLRQKEIYTALQANDKIDLSMFSLQDPWQYHWYKEDKH